MATFTNDLSAGLRRVHTTARTMAELVNADPDALGLPAGPFTKGDPVALAAHALALFGALQALSAAVSVAQSATDEARNDFRFGWVTDAIGKAADDIAAVRMWALLANATYTPGVLNGGFAADRAARRITYRLPLLREAVGDYAGV